MSGMKLVTVGMGQSFKAGLCASVCGDRTFEDLEVWDYTPGPAGNRDEKGWEGSARKAAHDADVVVVRTLDKYVNGLELLQKLPQTPKCKKVAVLSENIAGDDERLFELVRMGVVAYLVGERCTEADVIGTIRHVCSGEYPAADAVLSRASVALSVLEAFHEGAGDDTSSISLSPPEERMLRLVGEGASQESVASSLGISVSTMKKRAGRVLEKLVARDAERSKTMRNALLRLQVARDGNLLPFGATPFADGSQEASGGRLRK
jgi:NarL family two-component system response regulator LiaR